MILKVGRASFTFKLRKVCLVLDHSHVNIEDYTEHFNEKQTEMVLEPF